MPLYLLLWIGDCVNPLQTKSVPLGDYVHRGNTSSQFRDAIYAYNVLLNFPKPFPMLYS